MKKRKIEITESQARLFLESIEMALDLNSKFLRHDDWDYEMTKKQKHEAKWPERQFGKAIQILEKKLRSKDR